MKKTEILFLRHGESLGNSLKIMTGQTDVDLSERGYLQAEAAAEFLAGQGIDVIYSSDLKRAYNTALKVSEKIGLPIITSKELREIFIGDFEGIKMEDLSAEVGESFAKYWTTDFGIYSFPNGESTLEAGERFYREVERIAKAEAGERILIATHAGVIRSFWGIMKNIPRAELGSAYMFASNASVSRVEYNGESFFEISYSENEHLKKIGFIDYSKGRI